MKKLLLLIIVSLVLTGVASGTTTWTDGDAGDSLWSTPGNWDAGIPDAADWAKIRAGVDAPAIITDGIDAVAQKTHLGYSQGGAIIMDGGTLTHPTGDLLLGKNGGPGILTISGGTISCNDLEVAGGNPGTINMTGGTINATDDFMVPESAGSTAEVNILGGGTITVGDDLDMDVAGSGSLNLVRGTVDVNDDIRMVAGGVPIDIKFGTLLIGDSGVDTNGARLTEYVGNGWITGFGDPCNVSVVNDGETITVTATADPLARTPTMDGYAYISATSPLSWINLPADVGSDVWVDVYFNKVSDTDPNSYQILGAGLNTTGVAVDANVDGQEYIWQVNSYLSGDPGVVVYGDDGDPNTTPEQENNIDEGVTMYFTALSDFPPEVVIDTPPTATWANEPLQLDATVTDDAVSTVTYAWTSDEPNAVFSDPAAEDPTVTVNYLSGAFNVTVTVSDDNLLGVTGQDSEGMYCATDACTAARSPVELADDYPADIAIDCEHDLADFALIAGDWLIDYTITEPTAIPQ